ncbi:MAG: carbohydrate binding domain-containing protein [Actinobacteria bacterium]|nr:carbohydrate binding domain-containing protein [Actinomycetota bacterium]
MRFLNRLSEYLRQRQYRPLWHALSILVIIVASWGLFYTHFFSRGTLMYVDMSFPTSVGRNMELYNHMWWQYGSVMNIWNVQRLFWSYPLLFICKILGLSSASYLLILFSGTLALAGISMYILAFSLLGAWGLGRKKTSSLFIGSVLAGIIYMYNPFSLAHLWPYFGYPGYALLPLAFWLLKKAVDNRSTGYTVALAVVISLASTGPICIIWFWLMIFTYLMFDLGLKRFKKKEVLADLKLFGITIAVYAGIGMLWILPYLYSLLSSKPFVPSYVPRLTQSAMDSLSGGNTIVSNMRLISGWGMPFDMSPSNWFWTILSFALVVTSIVGFALLLKRRGGKPSAVYWASVSVAAIVLATGTSSIIRGLYSYIVLGAPQASAYGWILRSPDRWLVYVPIFYALMCAFVTARLIEGNIPAGKVLAVVVIAVLIISLLPVTIGFATKVYDSTDIPEDYAQVNEFIEQKAGDNARILWMPFFRDGFRFYWAPYKRIGAFYTYSSNPSINDLQNPYNLHSYFYWLNTLLSGTAALGDAVITEYDLMLGNDIIARLLAPFAPEYLIFDNSVPGFRFGDVFTTDRSLELADKTEWLDVFQLLYGPEHIRAATNTIMANDFYDNLSVSRAMTPEHFEKIAFIDDDLALGKKYGAVSLMDHLEPVSKNGGFEETDRSGFTSHWLPEDFSRGTLMHTDNTVKRDGEVSLRVLNRDAYDLGINWIHGAPIPVTPGSIYVVESSVKYRNSEWTHIVVEGRKQATGEWVRLVYCPTVGSGTSKWKDYQSSFYVPEGIDSIRVRLAAGWVKDTMKGPAVSWFDNVRLSKVNPTLYWEMVERGDPPVVTSTQVSPEKYKVTVKGAERPFVLVMSEAYDAMWEAKVEGGKTVDAIPLYATINGFPIDKTGDYTITIEYASQKWFTMGLAVSLLSLVLCLLYLVYCWERKTGAFGRAKTRMSPGEMPWARTALGKVVINKNTLGTLCVAAVFTLLWAFMSFSGALFASLLLICLIWGVDSRYAFIASLFLLVLCPVFMVLGENGLGDLAALWAFLFLVVGMFLSVVRRSRGPNWD